MPKKTRSPHSTLRPTLRDVARLVGVSTNTVSVILNGRPSAADYSDETCVRVRAAAEQLGYCPNPLAQVLKRKRSNLVGMVVFTRESNFYTVMLQAADETFQANGFETITADVGKVNSRLEQNLHLLMAWRVEGILAILGGHVFDRQRLDALRRNGTGLVLIGPYRPEYPIPCLNVDNFSAGRTIGQHLIALGHRKIGVLAGNYEHDCSLERIRGLRTVLSENNVERLERQIVRAENCRFEVATGYHGAAILLGRMPDLTALVCVNDEMAIGAISYIREHGKAIPADISVTGFDDGFLGDSSIPENRLGLHTVPPLTTMRVPLDAMGRTAAEKLLTALRDPDRSPGVYLTEFPAELIVRASTGPART